MISESGVCYLISLERYLSSMCSLFLVFIEVIASFFRWYRAFVPVVTVGSIVYRLVEMFLTSVVIHKILFGTGFPSFSCFGLESRRACRTFRRAYLVLTSIHNPESLSLFKNLPGGL